MVNAVLVVLGVPKVSLPVTLKAMTCASSRIFFRISKVNMVLNVHRNRTVY